MSGTMIDAFMKTDKGQTLLIEAKNGQREIADRIRQLKQLVHSTFVSDVPRGHAKRFDVYQMAKGKIRELGRKGGNEFDEAILAVKFAWSSRKSYKQAIEIFEPNEFAEVNGDCESSDGQTRY